MIILRIIGALWGLLCICAVGFVFLCICHSDTSEYRDLDRDAGWADHVLEPQKIYLILEYPNATNEERSEILWQHTEKTRLEDVRAGRLSPDWRPPTNPDWRPG